MYRKFVAVVIGATLMLGVVGVGAAPAGAQPTGTLPAGAQPTGTLPTGTLPSSLDGLVAQIEQVCSEQSQGDLAAMSPRLTTACAQLPTLELLVAQVNEVCSAFGTAPIAGPKICQKIQVYSN